MFTGILHVLLASVWRSRKIKRKNNFRVLLKLIPCPLLWPMGFLLFLLSKIFFLKSLSPVRNYELRLDGSGRAHRLTSVEFKARPSSCSRSQQWWLRHRLLWNLQRKKGKRVFDLLFSALDTLLSLTIFPSLLSLVK